MLHPRKVGFKPRLELLEARSLMAVLVESLDGTGNNVSHPNWGGDSAQLLRTAPAQYADGASLPAGAGRPSARAISDLIAAHPADELKNNRDLTAFVYAFGQFLDHDLDLTVAASPREAFNVPVPTGDPSFDPGKTGTQTIALTRSQFDPATGTSAANPRQQLNSITAFIDGSQVYGSTADRAAALRTFVGGKLKTSDGNLLPFNTTGLPNANDAHLVPDNQLFLAGDVRANENIELTAMQTLFAREHNRLAEQIAHAHPELSDEAIYQQARKIVIAELQAITYNEFLPALLGPHALQPYQKYNPLVNPGIANEFSTAAFRFGHSMLDNDIKFLDNQGNPVRDEIGLREAFFNPGVVEATGIDPIMKYLASDRAEEIDTKVVDDVRNFLFGPPGAGGFDLVSLNIQRGRDHGLADYNTVRASYGLPRVKQFSEITSDAAVQQQLQQLYGTVDNIDLWVGGLAESHLPGASMGPTFTKILVDQFTRLRDGDRFWYQNTMSQGDARQISQTTLADIVRRNTTVSNLQADVFMLHTSISGRVTTPNDELGRSQHPGDHGIGGVLVQLLDSNGNVVASTNTAADGGYRFTELDLGTYTVQITPPAGGKQTNILTRSVQITRGMDVRQIDFGLLLGRLKSPDSPPDGSGHHTPPSDHHGGPHNGFDSALAAVTGPVGQKPRQGGG